jgi:hypothetical protein
LLSERFAALAHAFTVEAPRELVLRVNDAFQDLSSPGNFDARYVMRDEPDGRVNLYLAGRRIDAATTGVLTALIHSVNLHADSLTKDTPVVHAGVVSVEGSGAILFPGGSGAGKTSLVLALIEGGAQYLTDELAAIDHGAHVAPFPKPLSLKPGTQRTLHDRAWAPKVTTPWDDEVWHVPASLIRPGCVAKSSVALGAMVFPEFEQGASPDLSPLHRAEAFVRLGKTMTNLAASASSWGLDHLADLVRRVEPYKLRFSDAREGAAVVLRLVGA